MNSKFIPVPLCRQATSYTCGPASLQSVLGYYLDEYQEDYLANELHTIEVIGTDFREILRLGNALSYQTDFCEHMSIDTLKDYINEEIPVILMIQAWSNIALTTPDRYTNSWDDGHYVVACGYDDKNIILMDPSTLGYYTYLPIPHLLSRWHLNDFYGEYYQSGIIIRSTKTSQRYQPTKLKRIG